ncbi:hypothetical protein PR202_ga21791 [Eleusine coracana subsp. coracana]|uniref:F-box domain-containing protein n=1 Tax=Eleusine coracana subsp. coracana TaxID=191504 RepID=A0AAV5CZZ0_ELECO|nr:hypothetical protein PR202_ga21791 [Eleusine coracana subsp. coracana]
MAAADENETNKLLLRLPDDVVSDILSRLAPRGMAVSRSVCKSWRDVVDSRRLLRAHLLPLSVAGIFFRHTGADILFPPLFFDGASSTAISDGILARFGNDYTSYTYLHDHCNGLLLINKYVINPATLQRVTLPERPPPVPYVLLLPAAAGEEEEEEVVHCQTHVPRFRSDRLAAGGITRRMVATFATPPARLLLEDSAMGTENGAYCRGRLYLQYDNDYVTRINTSAGTYDLIQPPDGIDATKETQVYLGKSEKGVYYASVSYWLCRLQIWYLDESNEQQPQWVSRYDNTLLHVLPCNCNYRSDDDGPWILRYYDYDYDDDEEPWISPPNTDHDYVCPCRFHHHHPSDDHCHKQQVVNAAHYG